MPDLPIAIGLEFFDQLVGNDTLLFGSFLCFSFIITNRTRRGRPSLCFPFFPMFFVFPFSVCLLILPWLPFDFFAAFAFVFALATADLPAFWEACFGGSQLSLSLPVPLSLPLSLLLPVPLASSESSSDESATASSFWMHQVPKRNYLVFGGCFLLLVENYT